MRLPGVLLLSGSGVLLVGSFFVIAYGNSHDDEWIDPYDMLNYDASSKSMKKPAEASSYSNVPTKRREYTPDSSSGTQCPDITECTNKVNTLQREIEEHKRRVSSSSHQPTCNPVFKRFLSKLLKEIEKLGLPTAVNTDMHYDAEVKLSKQMVAEIQNLLNDESSWRTGALDDALSQILVNFKLHDYEAWKWRFEDTFSVEPETVIKVFILILIIVAIICTEMWSTVSWFVQFRRMFAICFFISIVWNWFYLYKIAFAEHQANIVKMENINEKCTGVKKIDWKDNLREWFRTTWTLQDDPCKQYYEVLIVNPILLVPPTKAITITITTFITDPLKQFGQGISEFLRALLKDLPVTLQIPVLLTIVLSILVFMYGSAQAAIQHVALRPLRGGRRDPPPAVQQSNAPPLREPDREEQRDQWAGGDAGHDPPLRLRHRAGQEGNRVNQMGNRANEDCDRPEISQRRRNGPREERRKVYVETLRNADLYSGDDTDNLQGAAADDSGVQQGTEAEPPADVNKEEKKTPAHSNTEQKPAQPVPKGQSAECNNSDNTTSRDNQRNDLELSAGVLDPSSKEEHVETIGTPVQESLQ
ncbi:chloride channel CLIC-like protein 1 [Pygocentrus nattereri]|uniref:Chloride channel CLIC-like protein 1 n=1 Tax=Pygocentrus nattereri TaxID=42514 RepID=A0A3B4CDE9_PYGNA|nr:chloride channel CLIC-like protein 1 [Pygocentrus nattereri]